MDTKDVVSKLYRLYRKKMIIQMVIFLYNLHIFAWIQHSCLANIVFALDTSNSVKERFWCICTLQPLYNTVCYNTVLDITRFKDGSQKCIDYIEK